MVVWDGHSLNCRIGGYWVCNCVTSKRPLRIVVLRECGWFIAIRKSTPMYTSYCRRVAGGKLAASLYEFENCGRWRCGSAGVFLFKASVRCKDMREELNEILRRIGKNSDALEALREIERRGLDKEVVLRDLFLFCGVTPEQVRAQLEKDKRFRDELIDVANQLERLSHRVEIIAPKIDEKFGIRIHGDDLAASLRDRAELYRKFVTGVYGPYLRNVRIGGKEGRKANVSSGRDQVFLHLIYQVSKGKKPKLEHYRLVAPLVAAAARDKSDLPVISDRLLQKFKRFASKGDRKDRQRRKDDAREIAASVREELQERHRAHTASRKDTFPPKKS